MQALYSIQKAAPTGPQILEAMYWDLSSVWQLQQILTKNPSVEEKGVYHKHCDAVEVFVDYAVRYKLDAVNQSTGIYPLMANRCRFFLFRYTWAFFAMCALSESFREAYYHEDPLVWDELMKQINLNQRSIEVFVRSRKIDWRAALQPSLRWGIPGMSEAFYADVDLGQEHVHHTVQTPEGGLKRPVHQGQAQTNINSMIFHPSKTVKKSPLLRPQTIGPCMACLCTMICPCHDVGGMPDCRKCKCPKVCKCSNPDWVRCAGCGSRESCRCSIECKAGDLVELVQYPIKGTGIRALASFKAGTVLGEYVGEVLPNDRECTDEIYALSQLGYQGLCETFDEADPIATTTAAYLGNWTRFINHHCEANCTFFPLVVGDKVTTIVQTTRDISAFDEITVNYGRDYWHSRYCYCGSENCYNPAP